MFFISGVWLKFFNIKLYIWHEPKFCQTLFADSQFFSGTSTDFLVGSDFVWKRLGYPDQCGQDNPIFSKQNPGQ